MPYGEVTPAAFRRSMQFLESEFGRVWLENSGQGPGKHPLRRGWNEIRLALGALERAEEASVSELMMRTHVLATELAQIRGLPHYLETLFADLKKRDKFESTAYEVDVAARAANTYREVEFVPTSTVANERTPDIRVRHMQHWVPIECKRKRLKHTETTANWDSVREAILALQSELGVFYEVRVVALGGLHPGSAAAIAAESAPIMRAGINDRFRDLDLGYAVILRRTTPPSGGQQGVIVGGGASASAAQGTVYINELGQTRIRGQHTVTLFTLGVHLLSSVLSSIKRASGQIRTTNPGLVYVDVDLSAIVEGDRNFYVEFMSDAIERRLTADHPEVGAVAVTARWAHLSGPGAPDMKYLIGVAFNADAPLPDGFLIPGLAGARRVGPVWADLQPAPHTRQGRS